MLILKKEKQVFFPGILNVQCLIIYDVCFSFPEPQPSITGMSQDSNSLDSRSLISHYRTGDGDVDSHASMIPQPRSTTVSITSSLENVHSNSSGAVNLCSGLPEVSCERDEPVLSKEDVATSQTSPASVGCHVFKEECIIHHNDKLSRNGESMISKESI